MHKLRSFSAVLLSALVFSSHLSLAQDTGGGGVNSGGGGEGLDIAFNDARRTIKQWYRDSGENGPEKLDLRGIYYPVYREKMSSSLDSDDIRLTFVTRDEEDATDNPELKFTYGSQDICTVTPGRQFLCSTERFKLLNEIGVIELVHHLHALLAGIETDKQLFKDVYVSSQLHKYSYFTEDTRLSITPIPPKTPQFISYSPKRHTREPWKRGGYETEVGYQTVVEKDERFVVRFSYSGNPEYGCMSRSGCGRGSQGGAGQHDYNYIFDAQAGISLSKKHINQLNINFVPVRLDDRGVQRIRQLDLFPVVARREVTLANAGKLKIDVIKVQGVYHSDKKAFYEDAPDKGKGRFIILAALSGIGSQLLVKGDDKNHEALGGLDFGEATIETGLARTSKRGFTTQLMIGASIDASLLWGSDRMRIASERSAFAKLSLRLDEFLTGAEAYVQGDAGQLQVGKADALSILSIKAGALLRY